ncbi:hypothetical protein [Nocardia sp. CA-120079]|uniref:hypothetical protein n=1 Tax=Nocardia sp. CA-120079 TaxID=3239974 RepID=UPI003D9982D2
MRAEDLAAAVITSVADAIGLEETRISLESSLIDELGTEPIDLWDMWFRTLRDSGVEISGAEVATLLRGDIPRRIRRARWSARRGWPISSEYYRSSAAIHWPTHCEMIRCTVW